MNLSSAALAWYDSGCSIWPPMMDGTKRPAGEWKRFMRERAPRDLIEDLYGKGSQDGVGIVCGKISGNLEMLEFESEAVDSASLDKVFREAESRGVADLLSQLIYDGYSEWTPSGGLHMIYRVNGNPVPGNTKVARRPSTPQELEANPADKIRTLSETRGEGGYVVVAPSAGSVHPSGQSWEVYNGKIGSIPTITWEQRCLLLESIEAGLDQMPRQPQFERPPAPRAIALDASRAGDDFQIRASWEEILEPHGWRVHHRTLRETFWTRPGKKRTEGWSATTGYAGHGLDDRLFVWSSSTEFDTERPYNKFAAYSILEHRGDFSAAAKSLASRGYGSPATVGMAQVVPASTDTSVVGALPVPQVHGGAVEEAQAPVVAAVSGPERDALGIPVYAPGTFKGMAWNGIGIARRWVDMNHGTFGYLAQDKQWMMWDGQRWIADHRLRHEHSAIQMASALVEQAKQVSEGDDAALGKALVKEAKKMTYAPAIASLIRNARSDPRMSMCHEDFDPVKNLMTVENGILDLNTMQLSPHDSAKMLTRKVNAAYDPQAPKGRWHQFMEEVLPDPAVRSYLQRVCGYMLTGELNERAMILLYGESGTGKTQFLEALREVMGDFSGVAPASAFQPRQQGYKGPSEDLHKLRGKRFVVQSELDAGSRFNEALVKSIVGADTQSTRPLYGAPVDWQPEYTVFLATNHLPRISSSENAIWNRVKPIKFDQVFISDTGQALNPEDKNLGRRMAQQEAASILNWLLEGLAEYRKLGLAQPEQIGDWVRGYREDVDTVRQFLKEAPDEDRICVEEGTHITVTELYRTYDTWCRDNGITPLGLRNFTLRMESAGFEKKKKERGICWLGIGKPAGSWLASGTYQGSGSWASRRE